MKIISKFKDYYDFVAHQYGGGDPAIVYTRLKIKIGESNTINYTPSDSRVLAEFSIKSVDLPTSVALPIRHEDTQWLFVCGRRYLLIGSIINHTMKVLNKVDHPEVWDFIFNPEYSGEQISRDLPTIHGRRNYSDLVDYYFGYSLREFDEFSKLVGQPVFTVSSRWHYTREGNIHVDENVPILDKLGFGPQMKPELLYQELQHYITNVLRENPDITAPVQISNKDRIVQHGFDLKQSFRHRKA